MTSEVGSKDIGAESMTTLRGDLDLITSILEETFRTGPFKREYDAVFGRVGDILRRHRLSENPRNLRFRFILCMQEFFDSIPQDQTSGV